MLRWIRRLSQRLLEREHSICLANCCRCGGYWRRIGMAWMRNGGLPRCPDVTDIMIWGCSLRLTVDPRSGMKVRQRTEHGMRNSPRVCTKVLRRNMWIILVPIPRMPLPFCWRIFVRWCRRVNQRRKGAIRARFWLHLLSPLDGKGCGICSEWCDLDAADGLELDICGLRDWQRGLGSEATVLAFLGVEVSEKRGRHWVRLPFACGLRVLGEVVLANGRMRAADRGRVRGNGRLSCPRVGRWVDLRVDQLARVRAGLHPALGDCALSGLWRVRGPD